MEADDLRFEEHGAVRYNRAALCALAELEAVSAGCPTERPGVRLHDHSALAALLAPERAIGQIAVDRIGPAARPVRAVLFDKTPATNWALGWHQDRTIAVRERHDVPGYGPWSKKAGTIHAEPPFDVIEAMVTLRIHLDDVPPDNAPLLIAPGSHRMGRIVETELGAVVDRCGSAACLAQRGDIWAYSTPIVHASSASTSHGHRRVLQVDYAASALPAPLAWLGIG